MKADFKKICYVSPATVPVSRIGAIKQIVPEAEVHTSDFLKGIECIRFPYESKKDLKFQVITPEQFLSDNSDNSEEKFFANMRAELER